MRKKTLACLLVWYSMVLGLSWAEKSEINPPVAPDFPGLERPDLTLADALRLTLAHEPNILLAREDVNSKAGLKLQAAGVFDLTLFGKIAYEFMQRPLTSSEKEEQKKKRDNLRDDISKIEEKIGERDAEIAQLLRLRQELEAGRFPDSQFTNPQSQILWQTFKLLYDTGSPEQQARIRQRAIEWIDKEVARLTAERDQLMLFAREKRTELRRLGLMSDVAQRQKGTLDLQLVKRYRTGITLAPFVNLTGESFRYRGKGKSADYGGPGAEDVYNASLGFSVLVPLGRGKGAESAAAEEQSSIIDWEASRKTLAFTVSKSVLATVFSYLDVCRAQEVVRVYQRSSELQQRLAELVQALVDADEVPRAELSRMHARQAEVSSQLQAARSSLVQAQVALATSIGLDTSNPTLLPRAVEGFPSPPELQALASVSSKKLAEDAVWRRLDVAAARDLERSGKVLWRAAVVDLAAKKDLDLRFSYAGLSDAGGNMGHNLGRVFFGNWAGPSASLVLAVEKPLANLTQRGQMEHRQAIWIQRQIVLADAERRAKLDVLQTFLTLQHLLTRLEAAKASAEAARQAFENELEKFRFGRSTLIDTILTEQRAVEAEVAVLQAQFAVAQTLAKLRFDTGTLVEETAPGEFRVAEDLWALPVVRR